MITQLTSIASDTAFGLVGAVLAQAKSQGLNVAVCVVDVHGQVLGSARMDGASPPILEFATDKAFTAANMRRTTEGFAARMGSSPALTMGLASRPRLLVWGGGLPIVHEGKVVGGIGVSGATDAEDIACAQAALRAAGLGWEI
ncbi:GlcG/HbpS family heme-binding protein [Paracoccus pacificus]|uniref:Heme-binding protein n=1 Tax=Paracoccus pacificus TaxID=1463598 RepID=A0ABW4R1X9_9RHOB